MLAIQIPLYEVKVNSFKTDYKSDLTKLLKIQNISKCRPAFISQLPIAKNTVFSGRC